jgi:hypothetical protein
LTIAQDRVQMSARFKGKIQGPSENNEIWKHGIIVKVFEFIRAFNICH